MSVNFFRNNQQRKRYVERHQTCKCRFDLKTATVKHCALHKAAPRMLEALRLADAYIDDPNSAEDPWPAIRAAIEKAGGGPQ